jgi:transcriptional regulator with XRE-family HTH domain
MRIISRRFRPDRQSQEQAWRRSFAAELRAARQRAGFTQVVLAAALAMTEDVYARYEAGTIWPSIGRLRRLAEILGCSVEALLAFKRGAGGAAPCDLPSESAAVRRLLGQLRKARPETLRTVERFLDALDEHGGLRMPGDEPDE